jgi:hypothetical protein
MSDTLTQNQLPMAKKKEKKEFVPGARLPLSLIGTAGVAGLKIDPRKLKKTIRYAGIARRGDRKEA